MSNFSPLMATSAFKSTSRRSTIAPGDAGSSNRADGAHRRSRSLSRYSGRFQPPPPENEEFATPRGKFVNKTRGSGFGEISLDDLADEFFGTKGFEVEDEEIRSGSDSIRSGRSSRRSGGERFRMETESSRIRGRSASKNYDGSRQLRRSVSVARRRGDDLEDEKNIFSGELSRLDCGATGRNGVSGNDHNPRLRRSASVARYRFNDLESDADKSYGSSKLRSSDNGSSQLSSTKKLTNAFRPLRRSMSQKDFLQSGDCYSSHSSSLTDDEVQEVQSHKSGSEKTIKTVYSMEKAEDPTGDGDESGLYEAMRNEVRHAVHEIRTELEKVMVNNKSTSLANGVVNQPKVSDASNVIAEIRRNYTNKLEQSEKRKQDLLAELLAEEEHGQELTNIVRELLPTPKQAAPLARPRSRRKSNDRTRMSTCLTEEAERYIEDFLSNVEDTDISSFDGDRSETSSTLGGSAKLRGPVFHNTISEAHAILSKATSFPAETDGVLLPWLEWETSNDMYPSPCKGKAGGLWISAQEKANAADNNTHLSSLGSWSPESDESSPAVSSKCFSAAGGAKRSSFDMEEYLELQHRDDLYFEILNQRQKIESGTLILCGRAPW